MRYLGLIFSVLLTMASLSGCVTQRALLDLNASGHAIDPTSLVLRPSVGGDWTHAVSDSGITALDIADGTTTLTVTVPDGARLLGCGCKVTTTIADVSVAGVTVAVAFTGGSTLTATPNFVTAGDGNVAAGTLRGELYDYADNNVVTGAVAQLEVTISGGVDNTPSAGAMRCLVHYETLGALD